MQKAACALTSIPAPAIGVDEVGRGAACGPVVACAVRLRAGDGIDDIVIDLRDSKKLGPARRQALADRLRDRVEWAVRARSARAIDRANIRDTTLDAMADAIGCLDSTGRHAVVVDGCDRPNLADARAIHTLTKADDRIVEVAAAAIIAKAFRDALMSRLAMRYPQYDWERNAGYLTAPHRRQLRAHGPSEHHRRTFLRRVLD